MMRVGGRTIAAAAAFATAVAAVGGAFVAVPAAQAATVFSPVAVGARSGATRVPFPVDDEMQASVDVGSGNLMVTSSDRSAPGINGLVSFGLMFQSLALGSGSPITAGAAGPGWFLPTGQDTRLMANADGSLLFVGMDGREGTFTPVSGSSSYTAPAGFRDSLVKNADGSWPMTDLASRSVMSFGVDGRLTAQKDRNGQAVTYAYSDGNVSSATLPTGQVVTFAFTNGKLTSMTRPANGSLAAGAVTYGYDAGGRLSSITRPASPGGSSTATTLAYSTAGDLASITDPLGNVTSFTYDSGHRVTSVAQGTAALGMATTRFVYASSTQTLVASPTTSQSTAVASVPHTTYTLNSSQRVTSTVDPMGRTRGTTYTPFFDVASATNGTGATSSATYGGTGGPMTKATSGTGASQSWTYGTGVNAFNPASSQDSQGNSSLMTYDGVGNPSSSTSGGGAKASVTYNADGTPATSTDPAGHVTTYTESASGRYRKVLRRSPRHHSGLEAGEQELRVLPRVASQARVASSGHRVTVGDGHALPAVGHPSKGA